MATNWLVAFVDKGKCDIKTVQVNCYHAHNAAKVAMKDLEKTDPALAETVLKDTRSIRIDEA